MITQYNEELKRLLERFQEGYIRKDVSMVDSFMEDLFDRGKSVLIIGTSNDEWMVTYDEARELFISDWEYWGNFTLDIGSAGIHFFDNCALIHTDASVEYKFSSSEETFSRYTGYIKEYFDDNSRNSKKSDEAKLTEVNWVLAHFMQPRNKAERRYLWKLRLSIILTRSSGRWVIRQMQFSAPSSSPYVDGRICDGSQYEEAYAKDLKKLGDKSNSVKNDVKDIRSFLKNFNMDYLDSSLSPLNIAVRYFSGDAVLIDTDQNICTGIDALKFISRHRDLYDELIMNTDRSIIGTDGNGVWAAGVGLLKKTISRGDLFKSAAEYVKAVLYSDVPDREKLFKAERAAANAQWQAAMGENYVWPFRWEGLLSKQNDTFTFKYLQFSFSLNILLEGKTDEAIFIG